MSKIGVRLKINVKDIDKGRLFTGHKGVYLDATVFIDTDNADQYGNNGMITQDVSKEEQSQGVKGNILGNCKVFWKDHNAPQPMQQFQQPQQYNNQAFQGQPAQSQQSKAQAMQNGQGFDDFEDDIPFNAVQS